MARLDTFGNPLVLSDGDDIFSACARLAPDVLQVEVAAVSTSPVVDGMMKSVGGMVAVLNRCRQILAVNDAFFRGLHIVDAGATIGLRPGEAMACDHLAEAPEGCGSGRFCASCGAAIALVTSIQSGRAAEQKCIARFQRPQGALEMCLNVRATPLMIGPHRIIVLIMQDVTEQELQAETRQVFFHDLGNIVTALAGGTRLLLNRVGTGDSAAVAVARNMSRLQQELIIQRTLDGTGEEVVVQPQEMVAVGEIVGEVVDLLEYHPAARGKHLRTDVSADCVLHTTSSLLLRVLINMVVNALEATPHGGEVVLSVERCEAEVYFLVWNPGCIPLELQPRIFQRFFSTKGERGRGFGTYIMKLFGEQALGGTVTFTTSESDGTTFTLTIPQPHLAEGLGS